MKTALVLSLFVLCPSGAARAAADSIENSFVKVDAMIEKGAYAKAREALDDILAELQPDDPRQVRYHERIGASWLREGEVGVARECFTSALKAAQRLKIADDSVARAYTGIGLSLRRESNDKYALKFFKKALKLKLDEGTRMFVNDQIREIEGRRPQAAR